MPQLSLYHLTFPHGLHIGRGGVDSMYESLEYVPSDTLFAALLDIWMHQGRDVGEILPQEGGPPAFTVTSAFPFAGSVRFYPKPVDLSVLFSSTRLAEFGAGKNIKKIRYLSEKLLERASAGAVLDNDIQKDKEGEWVCKYSLQGGTFWLTEEEINSLPENILSYWEWEKGVKVQKKRPLSAVCGQAVYAFQNVPRVTVDRVNSSSNLFQSGRVMFNQGCGLWLGVVGQVQNIPDLLRLLGEGGLGGERTAGYGAFTFTQEPKKEFRSPSGGYAYLLNRWHPANEIEISFLKKGETSYKMVAVSGWLLSPGHASQRRKRIWLVGEGSLIAGNPLGDVANVCPDYEGKPGVSHPLHRAGFALALDWKRS